MAAALLIVACGDDAPTAPTAPAAVDLTPAASAGAAPAAANGDASKRPDHGGPADGVQQVIARLLEGNWTLRP